MTMIDIRQLEKTYRVKDKQGIIKDLFAPVFRDIKAVDTISLQIDKGEIVGFIGPNGAGKTTTIKMLVGILYPSGGTIRIDGKDPFADRKEHLRHVGVVFGQRKSLWPELSVHDNLEMIGALYHLPRQKVEARIKELSRLIGINEFLRQPFRKLSLGQQMRAELVSSLLHKPRLLFLDEPTIGMDIVAKAEFLDLLRSVNKKEGTTILLTSHDLHEIEQLCPRIVVINRGKILYDGTVKDVIPDQVIVRYQEKGRVLLKRMKRSQVRSFLAKVDLADVSISEIPLEEVIRRFYK